MGFSWIRGELWPKGDCMARARDRGKHNLKPKGAMGESDTKQQQQQDADDELLGDEDLWVVQPSPCRGRDLSHPSGQPLAAILSLTSVTRGRTGKRGSPSLHTLLWRCVGLCPSVKRSSECCPSSSQVASGPWHCTIIVT